MAFKNEDNEKNSSYENSKNDGAKASNNSSYENSNINIAEPSNNTHETAKSNTSELPKSSGSMSVKSSGSVSAKSNTSESAKSNNSETTKTNSSETAPERPDGSVETSKNGFSLRTITIVGQIEGHSQLPQGQKSTKYELLIPQLVEIEESEEIDGLLLILNTVGGDVEAGLALSELISGMKKPTASIVLGGGHSIGVPLAVSAKRSFIVPTATMTLHPVRISGLVLGAPQTFVQFSRMQERIVSFVCSHSKLKPERFRQLMLSNDEMTTDLGSILDGKQAVEEGLIDSIGGLSDAIEYLKGEIRNGNKKRGRTVKLFKKEQ